MMKINTKDTDHRGSSVLHRKLQMHTAGSVRWSALSLSLKSLSSAFLTRHFKPSSGNMLLFFCFSFQAEVLLGGERDKVSRGFLHPAVKLKS